MNDKPFGLMFHYFHGEGHPAGQGAISGSDFERIIDHYISNAELLPAHEWARRVDRGTARGRQVCVTFDDALRSQFDIALPVLRRKGLTAFWFVQSCVLTGEEGLLEAFRKFRTGCFPSVEEFYRSFYQRVTALFPAETVRRVNAAPPEGYLREYAFYTPEDRRFRYVRDCVLAPEEYVRAMKDMIGSMGTSVAELSSGVSLDGDCLKTLHREGHIVGLHSHSHPTSLADLSADRQHAEYQRNFDVLAEIVAEPPFAMAHPCNSYAPGTLEILREMGIRIGFRSNMSLLKYSRLELPRTDSTDLMQEVALGA